MQWIAHNAGVISALYFGGLIIAIGHLVSRVLPKDEKDDGNDTMSGIASLFD